MKIKDITYGAMLCGFYGMYVLLNLITGSNLEWMLFFFLNFPIMLYTMSFGVRKGLTLLVAITCLTVMLGSIYSVIIMVPNLIVGIVMGNSLRVGRSRVVAIVLNSCCWLVEIVITIVGGIFLLGYTFEQSTDLVKVFTFFSGRIDYRLIFLIYLIIYSISFGWLTFVYGDLIIKRLKRSNIKMKDFYIGEKK